MPGYATALSEEKRWQLIAYVRQFAKQDLSAFSKAVPVNNYKINKPTPSPYFPLPQKITNATASEEFVFMVDTVAKGLKRAWSIAFLPDQTLLIAERSGKILRFKFCKKRFDLSVILC
jgi:glucose/arabinose dehydrogenase